MTYDMRYCLLWSTGAEAWGKFGHFFFHQGVTGSDYHNFYSVFVFKILFWGYLTSSWYDVLGRDWLKQLLIPIHRTSHDLRHISVLSFDSWLPPSLVGF